MKSPVTGVGIRGLAILGAAGILGSASACSKGDGPEPRARHLVFISVDTLRTDRLGCYGGPNDSSPTIDRLAEEGALFENAYTTRGLTRPSLTSFFTSKYPAEHGVVSNKKDVRDEEWMLPERLQAAGFHTRCFNASGVLAPGRGNFSQGYKDNAYQYIPDDGLLASKAERYVRNRFGADGRREFLWVHFMNPHKPYEPPAPYDRQFTGDHEGAYDGSSLSLDRIYVDRVDLSAADREFIEGIYDGTIRFVDDGIAKILAALEESGHADDTLIVFAADHGEDLYSHNYYYYHANSIYRSTTSIAFLFHQPGQIPPQRIDGLVENIDFMPTVMSWLGVEESEPPAGPTHDARLRGLDLADVLTGCSVVKRDFVISRVDDTIFSARNREWSYVANPTGHTPSNPPEDGTYPIGAEELYHLPNDPDEQTNVLGDHPEIAANLSRAIAVWQSRLSDGSVPDADLSDDDIETLLQLGYIGPGEADRMRKSRRSKSGGGSEDAKNGSSNERRGR